MSFLRSYSLLSSAEICFAIAICPNVRIDYIGMCPGERLNEEMISPAEVFNAIVFEPFYAILP